MEFDIWTTHLNQRDLKIQTQRCKIVPTHIELCLAEDEFLILFLLRLNSKNI